MWVLVVLCVVLTFVIAIAAQLSVFKLSITQLVTFRRVTDDDS